MFADYRVPQVGASNVATTMSGASKYEELITESLLLSLLCLDPAPFGSAEVLARTAEHH